MSTKTSPPSSVVKIKKEVGNDEIKEFAETAMNELLGWYGYDNVDKIDLHNKTSRLKGPDGISSEENPVTKELNTTGSIIHHEDSIMCQESSREGSGSPNSIKNCEKQATNCGWCKRTVPQNSPEFLTTPDGPRYCSESCFAQSRRASFKRAKTCDWCRHVRHAVSYVDFQDGASQLQFCSDKCLNQYKMQIFCRETQAHLDMNPHLKDKGAETSSGGLITPDLWLKNCRSRSATPEQHSELSRSPTPTQSSTSQPVPAPYKPMISVAPPSKLLSRPQIAENLNHGAKYPRKRKISRINIGHNVNISGGGGGSGDSISNSGGIASTNNSFTSNPPRPVDGITNPTVIGSKPPCTFPNVQDLRMNSAGPPPLDRPHPIRNTINPSYFSPQLSSTFNLHPPFFNHPRLLGIEPPQHHTLPPLLAPTAVDPTAIQSLFGQPIPPITVMVPYPIIVPLPIPIPIPLPIGDFIKAAESRKNGAISTSTSPETIDSHPNPISDEPLDFTKSKNRSTENEELARKNEKAEELDLNQPVVVDSCLIEDNADKEILPKGKITRLASKRPSNGSSSSQRESEYSRPLRKRKRVIDCDYGKASKDDERTRPKK